jgi:hypothetical protein
MKTRFARPSHSMIPSLTLLSPCPLDSPTPYPADLSFTSIYTTQARGVVHGFEPREERPTMRMAWNSGWE